MMRRFVPASDLTPQASTTCCQPGAAGDGPGGVTGAVGVLVAPQRQQLTRLEAPGSSKPKKLRARGRKMKPRRARAAAAAAIKAEPEEEEEARRLRTSALHQPRTHSLRARTNDKSAS
jgi:hypothetical protein